MFTWISVFFLPANPARLLLISLSLFFFSHRLWYGVHSLRRPLRLGCRNALNLLLWANKGLSYLVLSCGTWWSRVSPPPPVCIMSRDVMCKVWDILWEGRKTPLSDLCLQRRSLPSLSFPDHISPLCSALHAASPPSFLPRLPHLSLLLKHRQN